MRTTLLIMTLFYCLTGCVRQRYFYQAEMPADLQMRPSDDAETLVTIPLDDVISTTKRLKPNGKYALVRYKNYGGYVRSGGGFTYKMSEKTKPTNLSVVDEAYGAEIGYSTNKTLRFAGLMKLNKNVFRAGYSEQSGGQKGKRVSEQLSNYGRTVIGSGNYLSSINLGYGREVYKNVVVEAEFSIGWRTYYTNYSDQRFNGGGYYLVSREDFTPGYGLGARYFVSENFNAFVGYNTLMGVNGGIAITFGGF